MAKSLHSIPIGSRVRARHIPHLHRVKKNLVNEWKVGTLVARKGIMLIVEFKSDIGGYAVEFYPKEVELYKKASGWGNR